MNVRVKFLCTTKTVFRLFFSKLSSFGVPYFIQYQNVIQIVIQNNFCPQQQTICKLMFKVYKMCVMSYGFWFTFLLSCIFGQSFLPWSCKPLSFLFWDIEQISILVPFFDSPFSHLSIIGRSLWKIWRTYIMRHNNNLIILVPSLCCSWILPSSNRCSDVSFTV